MAESIAQQHDNFLSVDIRRTFAWRNPGGISSSPWRPPGGFAIRLAKSRGAFAQQG